MKSALRPLTAITLVATAALALSACGTETLDTKKVESTIVSQFKDQGIDLTDTSCEKVDAEVGSPVRCTALNPSETKLFIEGKVTSRDGDKAHFEVKAVRGEAKGTEIAKGARALLEEQVGETAEDFTCPAKVVIPTTKPIRCVITVDGGTRYAVAVEVDGDSKVSAEVDDKPIS